MISYIRCLLSDPGTIPSFIDFMPASSIKTLNNEDFLSDIKKSCISFCHACGRNRPARAHHCSVCQKCILKKDHHCI